MDSADDNVDFDVYLPITEEDYALHHHDVKEEFEEEACDLLLQVAVPLGLEELLLLFFHVQLQEKAWSLNKLVSLILGGTLDDLTVIFEVAVLHVIRTIIIEGIINRFINLLRLFLHHKLTISMHAVRVIHAPLGELIDILKCLNFIIVLLVVITNSFISTTFVAVVRLLANVTIKMLIAWSTIASHLFLEYIATIVCHSRLDPMLRASSLLNRVDCFFGILFRL